MRMGDPCAHLDIEDGCTGQWVFPTVHWVVPLQLSALTPVSGPVVLQCVSAAYLGRYSHVVACFAIPVDNTQSQALLGMFITRLVTRTKESAVHACEESYL